MASARNLTKRNGDEYTLLLGIWALEFVAVSVLCVRLATSIKIYRKLFCADILMVLAIASAITNNVFVTREVEVGMLRFNTESIKQASHVTKLMVDATIFAALARWLGRVSFAMWILSLTYKKSVKVLLWLCIIVATGVDLTITFYMFDACRLKADTQLAQIQVALCWTSPTAWSLGDVQGAFATAINLTLSIIPSVLIYRLNMPGRLKMSCGAVLSVSFMAAAASLARLIMGRKLVDRLSVRPLELREFVLWTQTEIVILIIVASIPTIRPLFLAINRHKRVTTYVLPDGVDPKDPTITTTTLETATADNTEHSLTRPDSAVALPQQPYEPDYLTSWTGFVGCPMFTGNELERRMGTTITIQAGVKTDEEPNATRGQRRRWWWLGIGGSRTQTQYCHRDDGDQGFSMASNLGHSEGMDEVPAQELELKEFDFGIERSHSIDEPEHI